MIIIPENTPPADVARILRDQKQKSIGGQVKIGTFLLGRFSWETDTRDRSTLYFHFASSEAREKCELPWNGEIQ